MKKNLFWNNYFSKWTSVAVAACKQASSKKLQQEANWRRKKPNRFRPFKATQLIIF